jgi:hypothetical protein
MEEKSLDSWFDDIEADLAAKAAEEQDFVYIYEDEEGGILAITSHVLPEFEGLYTRKVWQDVPDAKAEEAGGLVYYDRLGAIRAVSFHPSEELTQQYDCVSIPRTIAEQLSSGELSTDDWFVGYTTTDRVNPRLLPRKTENRLIKLIQRDGWIKATEERPKGSAVLLLRIGIDERKCLLRLLHPGVEVASDVEEFTMLFTAPEDMATIYQGMKIKMSDLVKGDMIYPLRFDPTQPFDVLIPDIFEGFQREAALFISNVLPMPQGHFCDVVRVPWQTEYKPGLTVAVYRDERKVQFEFDKEEGAVYDRDLNNLPVLFTFRDNPGYLLHTARVSFYHLIQTGFLDIDIPDHLVADRFDIMLPLVFEKMVMKDRFVVGKDFIDNDWYEIPLTFTVPDRVALTATPNEDTNEIVFEVQYEHEAQEGMIFGFDALPFVMARRGDLSEFYERFQVPVVPLMRDGRFAVKVRTDVKLDFGLWTKRIFKSCRLVR